MVKTALVNFVVALWCYLIYRLCQRLYSMEAVWRELIYIKLPLLASIIKRGLKKNA